MSRYASCCPLLTIALTTTAALGALAGCEGSGHVKVAFDNGGTSHLLATTPTSDGVTSRQSALTAADGTTPDVFGVKITAIYLAEDVDAATLNNTGHVARIWTNPVCDAELHSCGISPNAGAFQVKEYFDLALPSDQVNANLNSQLASLKPGSYRYLRVSFVGIEQPPGQTTPDLRFGSASGTTSEVRFRANNYDVAIQPPLEIAEGDAVKVTLNYDLHGIYFTGPTLNASTPPDGITHDDWYCGEATSGSPPPGCVHFTGFSPAVSKL